MIDIFNEIRKCTPLSLDDTSQIIDDELTIILKNVTKSYERIGKEQYKSNSTLDEIIEALEASNENVNLNNEFKDILNVKDKKIGKLLGCLINFSDAFENLYMHAVKSRNEALITSLSFQKENNKKQLMLCGISILGFMGEVFDSKLHIAKEVRCNDTIQPGCIMEVLSNGYTYDGEVIRKAEVIINNQI